MFGKLFKGKEAPARRLDHPKDLLQGDIVTFKPRSILPSLLQGETLTVKKVSSYDYSDGLMTEFLLEASNGEVVSLSFDDEEDELCFSIKLNHNQISDVFDEGELGDLWSEESATLRVQSRPENLAAWLPESYYQTVKNANAYFYDTDRRGVEASDFIDDGAQELLYHECEGSPDQFSLNVEVWEDGETDIYLQISVPINVIEEMWPNGD